MREEIIGNCRLILGDCREILPTLGRVDALVTDPPYGVNLGTHLASKDRRIDRVLVKDGYISYDDTPENFEAIIVPAIKAALAISDRGLVFVAGRSAWLLPAPDAIGGVYLPSGCGRNKWGFASLAHCLLYGQAPGLELGCKATAKYSTDTVERNGHPCPKPLSWMMWAVNLATQTDHLCIDPFMGSGTTGVACAKLGRRFIGIELEPSYFDIARRRVEAAYAQPDLFVERPTPAEQLSLMVEG